MLSEQASSTVLYFPQRRYCALQLRDWSRGQVESAAEASAAMPSMLYDESMISTMVDVSGLGWSSTSLRRISHTHGDGGEMKMNTS